MRQLIGLASLLAISLCGWTAPAPRAKAAPALAAGQWSLNWGGSTWRMDLSPCGFCETVGASGDTWRGSWVWNGERRTFTMSEQRLHDDGSLGSVMAWDVRLDDALAGKASYTHTRHEVPVSFVRVAGVKREF